MYQGLTLRCQAKPTAWFTLQWPKTVCCSSSQKEVINICSVVGGRTGCDPVVSPPSLLAHPALFLLGSP